MEKLGEEENYKSIKNNIDVDYIVKSSEQNILLKNHWEKFNKKVEYLESIVKKEFGKTIEKIDLNGAKIVDYGAKYDPKLESLKIEITRLYLPAKGHNLIPLFASIFDNRLAPEVKEFREKYDVCSIECKISGIEYPIEKK